MNKSLYTFLIPFIFVILTACHRQPHWQLTAVHHLMPPLNFKLMDTRTQKIVTADDFKGKIVLLFFGYTSCSEICSTALMTFTQALHQADDKQNKVRILFVSVDPKRDSVAQLKQYAQAFGAEVIGLRTDSIETLKNIAKQYRATFGYSQPDTEGDYDVSHSSAVYIFDEQGELRLVGTPSDGSQAIAHDLKLLLSGN